MNTVSLSSLLSDIRAIADKAKAAALAETKSRNADLPTGHKLPSLVIANHAKASATASASKALIDALTSGQLIVKGAGKVLKSGDASIRIGAPLADLKTVVKQAQDRALAAADRRTVKRFREKFPTATEGKADDIVLAAARAHAAKVAAEKEAAKAEKAASERKVERLTPANELSDLLGKLEAAAA